MGLWNFIKDAGKAIGIGSAEAAEAPEKSAEAIEGELKDLGLDSSDVKVSVEGDKVKIAGKTTSQEQREKLILAAGNLEGIAAVEEEIEVPDAKEPVFHTVETGDTLWAIAKKYLGDGNRYNEIFEANRPMLSDPDKIYPGQNLRIPE